MCGKFTAMFSWREVHAFSQPLTAATDSGSNDHVVTYTPGHDLSVIVFERGTRQRSVEFMRWGLPRSRNPYDLHIHARCETIDSKPAFMESFANGQRGIVVMRTFNEGQEIVGPKGERKRSNGPLIRMTALRAASHSYGRRSSLTVKRKNAV